jgi:hypothetical protein
MGNNARPVPPAVPRQDKGALHPPRNPRMQAGKQTLKDVALNKRGHLFESLARGAISSNKGPRLTTVWVTF